MGNKKLDNPMIPKSVHLLPEQIHYIESVTKRGLSEWVREAVNRRISHDLKESLGRDLNGGEK